MKRNIFIPKTINVGYQNRSGTYTGKLAYVIYYDEKGKLRKEASWNSWRDKKIPNEEFDNVPTSGFVLNKKVGDYSSGWDHRQAYCRVYDPRNFEFEITIENLLYILENANSIKGKGLEGEFVYGWDGKDLVLMPVESPDYQRIVEYNRVVHNKESIKARDLIIGATYLSKNNDEQIYMGKFEHYDYGGSEDGKMFWFAYKYHDYDYVNGEMVYRKEFEWRFVAYKNLSGNKFIKCIEESCTSEYADLFEKLEHDERYSPYDSSKDKYIQYTLDEFIKFLDKKYAEYYNYPNLNNDSFEYEVYRKDGLYGCKIPWHWNRRESKNKEDYRKRFEFNVIEKPKRYSWSTQEYEYDFVPLTVEQLYEKLQPCYKIKYLRNGNEKGRENYYYGNEE
ncbi:MAG: hypothetical protein K2N51_18900 [Lachnospiraceae bacterium]|nr:hypothetical protein [Lachnospiraceae bacterium]